MSGAVSGAVVEKESPLDHLPCYPASLPFPKSLTEPQVEQVRRTFVLFKLIHTIYEQYMNNVHTYYIGDTVLRNIQRYNVPGTYILHSREVKYSD